MRRSGVRVPFSAPDYEQVTASMLWPFLLNLAWTRTREGASAQWALAGRAKRGHERRANARRGESPFRLQETEHLLNRGGVSFLRPLRHATTDVLRPKQASGSLIWANATETCPRLQHVGLGETDVLQSGFPASAFAQMEGQRGWERCNTSVVPCLGGRAFCPISPLFGSKS